MNAPDCNREQEIVAMVLSGRWPEGCDDDLRGHVASCEVCGDVAAVAAALREDNAAMRAAAHVPAAGQVWWRAAVRARLEAAQDAARPMTWLQAGVGAAAAGVAMAAIGAAWPSIERAAVWVGRRAASFDPTATDMATLVAGAVQQSLPLVLAVGAFVVIAPIVLYFALSDE